MDANILESQTDSATKIKSHLFFCPSVFYQTIPFPHPEHTQRLFLQTSKFFYSFKFKEQNMLTIYFKK